MSVLVDRVGVARRQLDVPALVAAAGRLLLVALAGLLWAIGWSARRGTSTIVALVRAVGIAGGWCAAAVRVGWSDGGP